MTYQSNEHMISYFWKDTLAVWHFIPKMPVRNFSPKSKLLVFMVLRI